MEHTLPFAVADHFNKLCSVMFPDSKVAAEFSCARTKTASCHSCVGTSGQ